MVAVTVKEAKLRRIAEMEMMDKKRWSPSWVMRLHVGRRAF
jgi:hypothetical protein